MVSSLTFMCIPFWVYSQKATKTDKFSKVAVFKISNQESVAFLYTNNELSERETKETITFIIASKIIKYLGINLNKDVKDLYPDNYKTLKKEIEATNK